MAAEYTTLESVRDSYMGQWNEDWDSWVEEQIPVASAMLRQEFRSYGRDLDDDLLTGKVDPILLEDVANSMIHRRIAASDSGIGGTNGIDYSQLSAAAGPYSFSLTPVGSNSRFYIRRDERRILGLPAVAMGGIDIHYFRSDRVSLSD